MFYNKIRVFEKILRCESYFGLFGSKAMAKGLIGKFRLILFDTSHINASDPNLDRARTIEQSSQ